jgi:hypothetical protein
MYKHDNGSLNFQKEIAVCKMNVEITAVTQNILKLYWRAYFLEFVNKCGRMKIQWFRRKLKVSTVIYCKLLSYKMRRKKIRNF